MEMTTLEKIERLQGLQQALEGSTRPVKGHTDPLSINDCWNWMRELLQELKDEHNGGSTLLAAGAASDDVHERLNAGRHYLMGVEADKITVEDALEAFGFGRNGLGRT